MFPAIKNHHKSVIGYAMEGAFAASNRGDVATMRTRPARDDTDRYDSRRLAMRELVLAGPLSRKAVAARLGLAQATVSRAASEFIAAGLVRELGENEDAGGAPGRREIPLGVRPEGGCVLGVGVGPTLQTVTLTDLANDVIAGIELRLDRVDRPRETVARLVDATRELLAEHGVSHTAWRKPFARSASRRLLGGVVMIAGQVCGRRGRLVASKWMGPAWRDLPLADEFAGLLGLPVRLESIASAILLYETRFGRARGRDDVLLFVCELGLGAAMVLDGRVIEGPGLPFAPVGDMKMSGGEGGTETLDRLAGGLGVLRRLDGAPRAARRSPPDDAVAPGGAVEGGTARRFREAVERDREGDETVAVAMAEAGRDLGRAACAFARLVRPETVVLAGPLSMAPNYVAAVGRAIADEGLPVDVVVSRVTGPVRDRSATCGVAICEYLFENAAVLPALLRYGGDGERDRPAGTPVG